MVQGQNARDPRRVPTPFGKKRRSTLPAAKVADIKGVDDAPRRPARTILKSRIDLYRTPVAFSATALVVLLGTPRVAGSG
jgi:hypothetical protein